MRVLVVDDDRMVLASCERVLREDGHEVIEAISSRAAVQMLEHGRFDLVLVDIKMPEYDGMAFIRAARSGSPSLPIIAMSGFPTEQTVSEALAAGASRFLAKPFLPDELTEAVREVAKGGR